MKKFIVLILMVLAACSSQVKNIVIPPEVEMPADLSVLQKFFRMTETDALRARQVIEKNKMVLNLSHLKGMDRGGKKYYLLEKENITDMINAVTEGVYADYILINSRGDIIYTRSDSGLFGENINKGFEDTPLRKCFCNSDDIHFEDVALMTNSSDTLGMYVSVPVYYEGARDGALILQIDICYINRLFNVPTDIISREGLVRIASDRSRILSMYNAFGEIDMASLDRNRNWLCTGSDRKTEYTLFSYKNISWIIAQNRM